MRPAPPPLPLRRSAPSARGLPVRPQGGSLPRLRSRRLTHAAYHVGVEWKWWPGPQTCAPASSGFGGTLDEIKRRIMRTPMVRCDAIPWSMLGLSMAGWNGVVSLLLGVGALSLTWRR